MCARLPTHLPDDTSYAEVHVVNGSTRVSRCKNTVPTKFLHPYLSDTAQCLMLSSYGGGFVQGDQVKQAFHCGADTRLLISSQANGRVYRNKQQSSTSVECAATVATGAKVVYFPDPLVLHLDGALRQQHSWTLEPGASLLLADWIQSGRSDSGEQFQFKTFDSEVSISIGDEMVVLDRFVFSPDEHLPSFAGVFATAQLLLVVYAVGPQAQAILHEALSPLVNRVRERSKVPPLGEESFSTKGSAYCALVDLEDRPVSVFRATGQSRTDFKEAIDALDKALSTPEWLGKDARLFPGRTV